jgi:hypothetical protein
MPGIDTHCRAQRQADPMQADGVVLTALPQHSQSRTAFGKKIFGVDFNEVKRLQRFKQITIVRMPPANADRCGMGCGLGDRNNSHPGFKNA